MTNAQLANAVAKNRTNLNPQQTKESIEGYSENIHSIYQEKGADGINDLQIKFVGPATKRAIIKILQTPEEKLAEDKKFSARSFKTIPRKAEESED